MRIRRKGGCNKVSDGNVEGLNTEWKVGSCGGGMGIIHNCH